MNVYMFDAKFIHERECCVSIVNGAIDVSSFSTVKIERAIILHMDLTLTSLTVMNS